MNVSTNILNAYKGTSNKKPKITEQDNNATSKKTILDGGGERSALPVGVIGIFFLPPDYRYSAAPGGRQPHDEERMR